MTLTDTTTKPKGVFASLMALVPKSVTITDDPAKDGLIYKAIVLVSGVAATWAYVHLKLTDPDYIAYLTGGITAALVVAVTFIAGFINSRVLTAKSMNAAITMKAAGASVLIDDPTLPGTVTDKPITSKTAPDILKQFGNMRISVDKEPVVKAGGGEVVGAP